MHNSHHTHTQDLQTTTTLIDRKSDKDIPEQTTENSTKHTKPGYRLLSIHQPFQPCHALFSLSCRNFFSNTFSFSLSFGGGGSISSPLRFHIFLLGGGSGSGSGSGGGGGSGFGVPQRLHFRCVTLIPCKQGNFVATRLETAGLC